MSKRLMVFGGLLILGVVVALFGPLPEEPEKYSVVSGLSYLDPETMVIEVIDPNHWAMVYSKGELYLVEKPVEITHRIPLPLEAFARIRQRLENDGWEFKENPQRENWGGIKYPDPNSLIDPNQISLPKRFG